MQSGFGTYSKNLHIVFVSSVEDYAIYYCKIALALLYGIQVAGNNTVSNFCPRLLFIEATRRGMQILANFALTTTQTH